MVVSVHHRGTFLDVEKHEGNQNSTKSTKVSGPANSHELRSCELREI
jgi:hypothetical protein